MTESTANYKDRAVRVLGTFQMLELSIKIYISAAYHVIRLRLDGEIPFNYDFWHVENFPLEKLLSVFSKLNSNKSLHARLNKLREQRNDVAHRALLYQDNFVRDLLGIDIRARSSSLSSTEKELNSCLELVSEELDLILKKYTSARARRRT